MLKYPLLPGETREEYKRRWHRVYNQKYKRKLYPNRRRFKSRLVSIDRDYITSRIELDQKTSCWNWKLGLSDSGYAMTTENRRHIRMHRKAYELWKGPVPNGQWVLHSCDNPKCVNPDHLFLGDALANMRDCLAKGRMPMGCDRPNAALSEEQVRLIRQLNGTMVGIAKMINVSKGVVWRVKRGKTYKTVV